MPTLPPQEARATPLACLMEFLAPLLPHLQHLSLKDGRCSNMLGVTRKAIALCAALYGTVAISGYVMFGKETQGDVLRNLTIRYVSTLVNPVLASILIDFIVLATTFNLLVSVSVVCMCVLGVGGWGWVGVTQGGDACSYRSGLMGSPNTRLR